MQGDGCDLLEVSFSFSKCHRETWASNDEIAKYIRFKSGPSELVHHCLWHILQFLICDCVKIKQNGYRNFVSWLVFLTSYVRRQLYVEG